MSPQAKVAVYLRSQHLAISQGLACQRASIYAYIPMSARNQVMEYVNTQAGQSQKQNLLADAQRGYFEQVRVASPERLSRIPSQVLGLCQRLLKVQLHVCFTTPELSLDDVESLADFSEYLMSAQDLYASQDDLSDDKRES